MAIIYKEHSLAEVIKYWADAYEPKEGKVRGYEYFTDPVKGMVIFKLFIEKGVDAVKYEAMSDILGLDGLVTIGTVWSLGAWKTKLHGLDVPQMIREGALKVF